MIGEFQVVGHVMKVMMGRLVSSVTDFLRIA